MKKTILILFAVALFASCEEDKKTQEYTIFKGSVANAEVDSIAIRSGDFIKKIALNEDGTFTDTLEIPDEGYYQLQVDREYTTLFLTPDSTHAVALDTKQFDESLEYSEANAAENNYLAEKFLLSEKIDFAPQAIRTMPEDSLIAKVEKNRKQYEALLNSNELDKNFVEMEQKALTYKENLTRQMYALFSEKDYYGGKEDAPSTANLLKKEIDLDNAGDYEKFSDYQQLVSLDFYKETSLLRPEDTTSYVDRAFNYIENLESENIKNSLLNQVAYQINPGNEYSEEIYNRVMATSTDSEFKEELTKKYEIIKKLEKGNPSPVFTYENHKGGETSLEDLKGKYVYIDVWATWCGPCLQQIPALKEIEEKYKNDNIHFVSISIDTDDAYDKWKEMVTEKELAGIQLIADNNWKSDFVQDYAIEGIPRFILIDPEGNIVSADAPRPTNPELITLFESLKI